MKNNRITTLSLSLLLACGAWTANAEDNPLNSAAENTTQIQVDSTSLETTWIDWVNTQPWSQGRYQGGAQQFPGKNIILSYGTAFVSTRTGQPGWNESRNTAYAKAELDARARLVGFLNEQLTTGRKFELLEDANFQDGVIQDMREVSEMSRTLERWGRKSMRLTDALLDKLISLADAEYDPAEFNTLPPEKQKVVVQELYQQSVMRVLTQALSGVSVVYSQETPLDQEYQVIVGILWSPKLDQLAASLGNRSAPTLKTGGGIDIEKWVAKLDETELPGVWGTRILTDEQGEYNVVAFAQAEPAIRSPARKQRALHRAGEIAENRARAMIANFVSERLVLKSNQDSREIYQELDDGSFATEIPRTLRKTVEGKRHRVHLQGLRTLKRWTLDHPVTKQPLAGAVVIWSPSSQEMAKQMARTMRNSATPAKKPEKPATKPAEKQPPQPVKAVTIDTSAY